MERPLKLLCYQIGGELHKDVDEVMAWPVPKIMEYVAFYKTQDKEWREQYREGTKQGEDLVAFIEAAFTSALGTKDGRRRNPSNKDNSG